MGLDLVELIIEVEERTGVHVPDENAHDLRTPGALIDFLWRQMNPDAHSPCPTQRAFHLLRRELMRMVPYPRSKVRPELQLSTSVLCELERTLGTRSWPSSKAIGAGCSVRELVPYVATSPEVGWSRPDVARLVQAITVEQLGLEPGEYREDADWIADLGAA